MVLRILFPSPLLLLLLFFCSSSSSSRCYFWHPPHVSMMITMKCTHQTVKRAARIKQWTAKADFKPWWPIRTNWLVWKRLSIFIHHSIGAECIRRLSLGRVCVCVPFKSFPSVFIRLVLAFSTILNIARTRARASLLQNADFLFLKTILVAQSPTWMF